MNWGYRIILLYTAFVASIVLLVVKSHGKTIDLVDKDYYQKELDYSQYMIAQQNYLALTDGIAVVQKPTSVLIALPNGHSEVQHRTLFFYKPSDPLFDKIFDISPDEKGILHVDKRLLAKGQYRIKLEWIKDNKAYAFEQTISLY